MARLWRLHGLTLKELLRRVCREIQDDDVFGQAAKLSFYFLLALFPLLLCLTVLFGYFAQGDEFRAGLLEYFRRVVPRSALRLVMKTLDEISSDAGRGKLLLGILGTLWAASNGIMAVSQGLNAAYEVKDERPWWKARLLALALTAAFVLFTVVALGLVLAGTRAGEFVAGALGLQALFTAGWTLSRWPVALFVVLVAVNLLYRFAPDLKDWKWTWISPGSLAAVFLWVAVSLGFRTYLRFFNSYNATYGSLGAVIILMLWFYITGAAILIGAEVNSEIESAAAEAGEPDARLPGEKKPGEQMHRRSLR